MNQAPEPLGAHHVLLGAQAASVTLPVCDHYCGTPALIVKSLKLQAELAQEFGACVFDVTLDCEDGAPAGHELEHANMLVAHMESAQGAIETVACDPAANAAQAGGPAALLRRAVRVHAVDHPAFAQDVSVIVGRCAPALSHVMVPKIQSLADVQRAVAHIDAACAKAGRSTTMPLHVLIESPEAVHQAYNIAAHPRVQSMSFGVMDFVSSHGGAIPESAMSVQGQFTHPLVLRAKLEIAAACHAHGKVPSHCVVTEFRDVAALGTAARRASQELGYTRMWSIHPAQIRPILEAFAPSGDAVETAARIIESARAASWAPISVDGRLHDRASYRFYWQLLQRAHQAGRTVPAGVRQMVQSAVA